MKIREFRSGRAAKTFLLILTIASLVKPGLEGAETDRKPNIVFILIDDMGWKDPGFMGNMDFRTPRIDGLARQGMIFDNAYANAPNCAPTRACLMSGQYSPRHGVYTVGASERGRSRDRKLIPIENTRTLAGEVLTLPEALKPAGYATALIGKWQLGSDPITQGFDVNVAGISVGRRPRYFSPYGIESLTDGPEGEYLTDRLTDEALRFIRDNKDRPFFLYLSHYAVHTPIRAKPELAAKYEKQFGGDSARATYAAMIESVDQSVGRVLDELDALGLERDTAVFFFSDNGGYGPITTMAPLRGSKGMLYEGGIREPMIVRWLGKVEPGGRSSVPVIGVDFYPTILEMAGVTAPEGKTLDGESLMPLLTQTGSLQREAIFWHFPAYLEAYRRDQGPWRTTPVSVVRMGDDKLLEFFEDGRLELYNLHDDIGETHNLAETMPEKTRRLHQVLRAWRDRVHAPVPMELNPDFIAKTAPSP